eukprot:SAG31_NODE_10_length_40133_cov_27.863041_14_plen_68_part_00
MLNSVHCMEGEQRGAAVKLNYKSICVTHGHTVVIDFHEYFCLVSFFGLLDPEDSSDLVRTKKKRRWQ